MSFFKEKSQGFIMGLLVGLLVAGGFFILKLDDYITELNLYKKVSETFTSESRAKDVNSEKEFSAAKKEKQEKDKVRKDVIIADSAKKAAPPVMNDTVRNPEPDTVAAVTNTDEIIVKKDELLFTKTLEVINLSPVASRGASKDSLLQKVSGVKEAPFKQFLNIEFWASPLNYKGYKLSKYRLVLYGMPSAEGMKLFRLDDVMYLKNPAGVFRLDYSADFRPYERLTDEAILSKLK